MSASRIGVSHHLKSVRHQVSNRRGPVAFRSRATRVMFGSRGANRDSPRVRVR